MIRSLANFSLRLWILTMLAGPFCFFFMPWVVRVFPGVHPVAAGVMMLGGLGLAIGTALDFMGRKWINASIKEGEIWERANILSRAEKHYAQAIRIYDSFLLSPFFTKKIGSHVAGSLARFTLTTELENPGFKLASAAYLKSNPGDETLAALWLDQLKKDGIAGPQEQEVLTALAGIHYAHNKLKIQLADVLLDLGRMDYPAKRLYKNLLDDPGLAPDLLLDYREKIHELLGEPEAIIEKSVDRRVVSKSTPTLGLTQWFKRQIPVFVSFFKGVIKTSGMALASVLSFLIIFSGRAIALAREREKIGFYIRAGLLSVLSLWVLFFMWNTISHILKSTAVEKKPGIVEIQVPKPFTIQVAAYLKQAHADRYLLVLNKKGIAAYIKKVGGGGKTWYVVRISEFSDKAGAAAFGKKLKDEKIIDDFFVSNK
jgi:hypothetical protein